MQLRLLSAAEVRQALPMADAIAGMRQAFAALWRGEAETPLRLRIANPAVDGVSLFMPAFLPAEDALAVKIVSVFPRNPQQNRPTTHALVLVLDTESGQPLALLEGGTLTAIRTGAGSGLATDLLARPDAEVVAMLGSGVQAYTQLEAVCTVRPVREVRVYSPTPGHAAAFAERVAGQGVVPRQVQAVADPAVAVAGADIICTATTSYTPVFPGRLLKPGAHVNAVGSFTPAMQEVDVETVQRSLVVVDSRQAALAEAGDLIVPLQTGAIDEAHIYAELGEVVAQGRGRTSDDQITLFKSVGLAVQDASAAAIALRNAAAQGLGTVVTL